MQSDKQWHQQIVFDSGQSSMSLIVTIYCIIEARICFDSSISRPTIGRIDLYYLYGSTKSIYIIRFINNKSYWAKQKEEGVIPFILLKLKGCPQGVVRR